MTDAAARLADVLDRQREDERERAIRALLARPLLAVPATELALVRRHAQYVRDWFARETGWTLLVERGFARRTATTLYTVVEDAEAVIAALLAEPPPEHAPRTSKI